MISLSQVIPQNRLKQLRKAHGLTLDDVERFTGINRGTFNNYENQTTNPKPEAWIKLADFFGVSVPYLMGYGNDLDKGDKMLHSTAKIEEPEEIIEHGKRLASDAFDDPVLKDFKTVIDYDGEATYEMHFVSRERLESLGWSEIVLVTYDTRNFALEAMFYERNRHFGTKISYTK